MDGSVTASVLTLGELVQAACAAQRSERLRLQAAPALHPALCRPGLIPASMKRSAATSHYIIMAKSWQGSKFPCSAFQRTQERAHWRAERTRTAEQCRSPRLCPHVLKARHIYGGGGGDTEAERRQDSAIIQLDLDPPPGPLHFTVWQTISGKLNDRLCKLNKSFAD